MSAVRTVRITFAAFVILFAIAVTYPGVRLFNDIRPLVFGLPLSFFWVALWVVLGGIMLLVTDLIESRAQRGKELR